MRADVTPSAAAQIFRFGEFELDVEGGELRRAGREVRLPPQPFRLLVFLVRRAGTLVSRDDIRAELWPDGTFVDFDQAVNFTVRQIRDALGDSADKPVYLQTVPRRGYRFIAPVGSPGHQASVDLLAPHAPGATTIRLQKALWANIAELRMAQRRQRRLLFMTVTAAVVAVAALLGYLIVR
jgi:DNA-binding winged helix-turn-helix (wHTH) protein